MAAEKKEEGVDECSKEKKRACERRERTTEKETKAKYGRRKEKETLLAK